MNRVTVGAGNVWAESRFGESSFVIGANDMEDDVKSRAKKILKILKKKYKGATTELNWKDPFQLLVATILSAQCTDVRVNQVTKELFKKYKTPKDFAEADIDELQEIIRPTGFFRQKSKSLINSSKAIVERFGGQVPDNMKELTELPGVARKTANVILGTAFGKNEGIAVDTHVGRVAVRLKLVSTDNTKDAVLIEKELMELFPRKDWSFVSHALILLGRYICQARKPKHDECPLKDVCPTYKQEISKKKK